MKQLILNLDYHDPDPLQDIHYTYNDYDFYNDIYYHDYEFSTDLYYDDYDINNHLYSDEYGISYHFPLDPRSKQLNLNLCMKRST